MNIFSINMIEWFESQYGFETFSVSNSVYMNGLSLSIMNGFEYRL